MDVMPSLLNPVEVEFNYDNVRFMFFSDPHLTHATPASRKDEYHATMVEKLNNLALIAGEFKCDFVLVGGDVWHTKKQPETYIIDVIHAFNQFPCDVYTIIGNHDTLYSRTDTIHRVAMGLLLSAGKVKRLGKISLHHSTSGMGAIIEGMDYVQNPKLPQTIKSENLTQILIAHNFLPKAMEWVGPEECFNEDDIKKCNWDYIFLGHDHMEYPIEVMYGRTIIRPGALSRGTKHVQNRFRNVCFNVCDLDSNGKLDVHQLNLPVKPAESIFSEVQIAREGVSKKMTEFVRSLATATIQEEDEVDTQLKKLCGADNEAYGCCKSYLVDAGVCKS